jgi:hypothetical protein
LRQDILDSIFILMYSYCFDHYMQQDFSLNTPDTLQIFVILIPDIQQDVCVLSENSMVNCLFRKLLNEGNN